MLLQDAAGSAAGAAEPRRMPLLVLLGFAFMSVIIVALVIRSVATSRTFGRRPPDKQD
jgi:hypothetical protein